MKLPWRSRSAFLVTAVLLLTNLITGLVTAWAVKSRDFSVLNRNCLLNEGNISAQFAEAWDKQHLSPHSFPANEKDVYHMHERYARLAVHHRRDTKRTGLNDTLPLTLFCWAVAADQYRNRDVDIAIDPLVWKAFLTDGPKDLSAYWELRQSLADAGANTGRLRGYDRMGWSRIIKHRPKECQLEPLGKPYPPN